MKRLISLALAVALLLVMGTQPAVADDEKVSGAYTYRVKGNGTAVITGYDWSSKDIYIPRMVDGYTVTEIGEGAFLSESGIEDINTLVIPDTVISIGAYAFSDLRIASINITIPSSVQYIGRGAFAGIRGLEQFTVASGNTVYATIDGVLFDKTKKELVAFPNKKGKKSLDCGIYYNPSYTIPDGILSIGDYAFEYANLGENFTIPETVETIGAYAFHGAEFYRDIGPGSNVEKKSLVFPKSIKSIGPYSFSETSFQPGGLLYILLDKTQLVEIPEGAFAGSDGAQQICFPASLKYIGNKAFADNKEMECLDLSSASNLLEIGDNAFSGCEEVKELNLAGTKLQRIGISAFQNMDIKGEVVLPETLTSIGSHAFSENNELLRITLPASVSEIGEDFCDRATVKLSTTPGTYAAVWASENGYIVEGGSEDTSWLTNP